MPHFFATHLDSASLPVKSGIFNFIFEAQNLKDKSVIILAEVVDSAPHTQIAETAPALSLRDLQRESKQSIGFANAVKQPSKVSPSLAEGNSNSLPLPCGGGLRGWVDSANAESNEKNSDSALQNNFATQKILLTKLQKNGKILVKFNKHFSVPSKELIKCALCEYARVTNAKILTHNLGCNSSLGMQFTRSLPHCVVNEPSVLFPSNGANFVQSHTANTSMVAPLCSQILRIEILRIAESNEKNDENVADSAFLLSWREICALLSQGKEQSKERSKSAMLEIGFGSGRNILNLARTNPHSAIIGLEIYRPAIAQVLRQIQLLGLQNLFVANLDARVLCEIVPRKSLDRIFLHFPVPWDKNPQRRVLSAQFLQNALGALKNGGFFELLTDSAEYFDFAKDLAKDYHFEAQENAGNAVVSKYEARWRRQGKVIYKLKIFSDGNSSLGNQFTRSLPHCVVNEPLVLFPSNGANFVQSNTANTSIEILRIAESSPNCHTEQGEVSQSLPLPCGGGQRGWVDSANAESDKKNGENIAESALDLSLRGESQDSPKQSKSICHFERSEKSLFRFCDSAILSPNFISKSLIFSQKGCTPHF
ncbi:tRNA (guanosine(46)-N7)-methyltransferase TrmB, partial [Helicobacter sp. 23-1044]